MRTGKIVEKTALLQEKSYALAHTESFLVYIFGRNAGKPYGVVAGRYLEKPVEFDGAGQLVLFLDEICRNQEEHERMPFDGSMLVELEKRSCTALCRAKEVLQISVTGCEHNNIQGRIKGRLTDGECIFFRSALELMRLLDRSGI